MIGQKANAIGKEAEEETHEEMRGALWRNALLLQAVGKLGEFRRRVLGDASLGGLWAEQLGIGEHGPQNFQGRQRAIRRWFGSKQIVQRKAVNQRARTREIGVNLEPLLIARYQQWWIFQISWSREDRSRLRFLVHTRDYVQHRKRLEVAVYELGGVQVGDHGADGDDSAKISGK